MLGVLCIVGCPVQLVREVFARLHFRRRHTFAFAFHYEALGYILPHFDELTHVAICGSSMLTTILLCIKHGSSLSSENVCGAWRLHETGLFSSAAVVPQSKSTEFCSSAAVVPRSKSTEI